MAIALRKQTILPVVTSRSDAFVKGYLSAQDNHPTGWPIKYAPRGDTIVEFLLQAHALLEDDGVNEDCHEVQYIACLLAGWLRRGI
jgi:hypothetical protein